MVKKEAAPRGKECDDQGSDLGSPQRATQSTRAEHSLCAALAFRAVATKRRTAPASRARRSAAPRRMRASGRGNGTGHTSEGLSPPVDLRLIRAALWFLSYEVLCPGDPELLPAEGHIFISCRAVGSHRPAAAAPEGDLREFPRTASTRQGAKGTFDGVNAQSPHQERSRSSDAPMTCGTNRVNARAQ